MPTDDRGPELAIAADIVLGISVLTVFLRCYVRVFILKLFRPEDWLAVCTLVFLIVYTALILLSIKYGEGRPLESLSKENISNVLQMRWAGEVTYIVTSIFLKLTVGVFLLRICSQRWHKLTIQITLVICVGFNIVYLFKTWFQCQPIKFYWEQYTNTTITGHCLDPRLVTGLTYAACGVNAGGDWVLGLLPIALVRRLDLGMRQKVWVAGILALGAVASVATIARLFYVWQLSLDSGDIMYTFTDLTIWSTVENGLGLTASSIATLRPLFKGFMGGARSSAASKQGVRTLHRNNNNTAALDTHGGVYESRLSSPRCAALRGPRSNDDHDGDSDSNGSVPLEEIRKHSRRVSAIYEVNKNVIENHYYPVSPKVARMRSNDNNL
ncbi:hypothetical protein F5Y14DRAFT_404866 [Nemania sp. NC0429]|nr:hypothetical protein F5Y14DRAFT_404866 [Nemania sp. NC0429]